MKAVQQGLRPPIVKVLVVYQAIYYSVYYYILNLESNGK
jgi:hypothetical protein